ncbi:hypothetical protein ACRALDRAFT_212582 [Sodiomyces alcalophilus JCM 7366]|uniref:uncharacterized protein n=1 Tax=Sodiomyces alcalophilus JCM 7366 TaxID=591952 RepID=UPI0039B5D586
MSKRTFTDHVTCNEDFQRRDPTNRSSESSPHTEPGITILGPYGGSLDEAEEILISHQDLIDGSKRRDTPQGARCSSGWRQGAFMRQQQITELDFQILGSERKSDLSLAVRDCRRNSGLHAGGRRRRVHPSSKNRTVHPFSSTKTRRRHRDEYAVRCIVTNPNVVWSDLNQSMGIGSKRLIGLRYFTCAERQGRGNGYCFAREIACSKSQVRTVRWGGGFAWGFICYQTQRYEVLYTTYEYFASFNSSVQVHRRFPSCPLEDNATNAQQARHSRDGIRLDGRMRFTTLVLVRADVPTGWDEHRYDVHPILTKLFMSGKQAAGQRSPGTDLSNIPTGIFYTESRPRIEGCGNVQEQHNRQRGRKYQNDDDMPSIRAPFLDYRSHDSTHAIHEDSTPTRSTGYDGDDRDLTIVRYEERRSVEFRASGWKSRVRTL